MSCHQSNWIIIFMWELIHFSGIVSEKPCSLAQLFNCDTDETCMQIKNSTQGTCICKKGFTRLREGGPCIHSSESNTAHPALPSPESVVSQGSSASAITVGLLVPLFLLTIIVTLAYAAKKYRWLHRVREHAHQLRARHYDTVLVSQEDDPPIA